MTVKEIIQIENGNRNTIILLREGNILACL